VTRRGLKQLLQERKVSRLSALEMRQVTINKVPAKAISLMDRVLRRADVCGAGVYNEGLRAAASDFATR
jgi:hypothetical protein